MNPPVWKIDMFRTLALAAALAAIALPALAAPAASVTINVSGMDTKTAHAAIVQAAQTACNAELSDSSQLVQFYARPGCVTDTVARAESKLNEMRALASR